MYLEKSITLYGTKNTIRLYGAKNNEIFDRVHHIMLNYNQLFNANNKQSYLMKLNQQAGLKAQTVPKELFKLIKLGLIHSQDKYSQLNIAIGPLVKLWSIGFSDAQYPNPEEIQEVLELCQPNLVSLDSKKSTVYLEKKGMEIDLGAIVKGYIADQIVSYLISQNIPSGFVNLGGNIKVFGPNPLRQDNLWHIGIQNPVKIRGEEIGKIVGKDMAIVTSGTYERKFIHHNKIFHHLISRETGYPIITNLNSLTIVSPTALTADTFSTKLFGLSHKKIQLILKKENEIEYLSISDNQQVKMSSKLKNNFYLKSTLK